MDASNKQFDVIIIGGSYAGLSAAMALGRSLRKVLIIDSGKPCNRFTPHSHNFLTQDGQEPQKIAAAAKQQVLKYPTVTFLEGQAVGGSKTGVDLRIITADGDVYEGKKLIFATGIVDELPAISGFSDCWGKTAIHCPYCHGYEFRQQQTGILANGSIAHHYAMLLVNLTSDLTVFTNGNADFTDEQLQQFSYHNIPIIEQELESISHENGNITQIILKGGAVHPMKALYYKAPFKLQSKVAELFGCELTEMGLIKVDQFLQTTIANIYACGDNSNPMRSVANAVATGNMAGAIVNSTLCNEQF